MSCGPRTALRRGVAFLVLALVAAGARQAAARDLTFTVTPDLPTWGDVVTLRVAGEVVTSCGPKVMRLANVRKPSTIGVQLLVQVDLVQDPCDVPTPPSLVRFAEEIELGHLLPGATTLRVYDLAEGGVADRELFVYEVSRLGFHVEQPAVDNASTTAFITHFESCASISVGHEGDVITVSYSSFCSIEPLPPFHHRTEVDLGLLPAGDYEVRLVDDFTALQRVPLRVWNASGCVPSDTALCLHGGRFRLTATWGAFDGSIGEAHAVPLAGNEGSGLLWFFGPDNSELTVKVLDACELERQWWVFLASASTVEYTLTVTDTTTGSSRQYHNPLGQVPALIADTDAFACP